MKHYNYDAAISLIFGAIFEDERAHHLFKKGGSSFIQSRKYRISSSDVLRSRDVLLKTLVC